MPGEGGKPLERRYTLRSPFLIEVPARNESVVVDQ